jgi:hypothetical protein
MECPANGETVIITLADGRSGMAWEPADAYARALEDEDAGPCSECSAGPLLGYPEDLCLACEDNPQAPAARG